MKFTFNHKTGENPTWTNAEVELLVKQHNDFIFREEIAPLKDVAKTEKENYTKLKGEFDEATQKAEKAAEKAVKELEAADALLKPFQLEKTKQERNEVAKSIIKDSKITDAMKLAGVTDEDTIDEVKQKLADFVKSEGREDYKFEKTAETDDEDDEAFKSAFKKSSTDEGEAEKEFDLEDLTDDDDEITW